MDGDGAPARARHRTRLQDRRLAYVSVLAALGLDGGIPLHVELAREAGATRSEVGSAVLIGLPAAGSRVLNALPAALAAFDAVEPART